MAEKDVLNPTPTHPLNPDWGYTRKRPVTHVALKASVGPAYQRELSDIAHQFLLDWSAKSLEDVRLLKRYYEQYRDGFFTFIDHEGGGREYVGRFTTPVEPVPTAHNSWGIQQVLFEEVPGAPMRHYPSDWVNSGIWRYPMSDFGELQPAVFPTGDWAIETGGAQSLTGFDLVNPGTNVGEWAQLTYVGYGFQFWARTGAASGIGALSLDGVTLANVDEYTNPNQSAHNLFQKIDVPLGMHTVRLTATNTKNAASAAFNLIWDSLRIMR